MAPGSRLSGDELLDTFLDIVLSDDELLAAEFADIVDGLSVGQPPARRSGEPARQGGPPDSTRQRPRRHGDNRPRAAPVPVVGGRGSARHRPDR